MKTIFRFDDEGGITYSDVEMDFPFKLTAGDNFDFFHYPIDFSDIEKFSYENYYKIDLVRYEFIKKELCQICFMQIA